MTPVAILGEGCVSPVGLSAPATCAALRAGIARMLAFEGWDDASLSTMEFACGRTPLEWLRGEGEMEWPGHEAWDLKPPRPQVLVTPGDARLVELALPAASEAWADADAPEGRVGLYLGLGEEDPARELRVTFEIERADKLGRAAGLAALHRAARHLEDGRIDVALVGGVDSRLRLAAILAMQEAGTLREEDNPAGVVPGEAAAFLVLVRAADGRRARGLLLGSAVAEEPTTRTEEANRGEGLTAAVRGARKAAGRLAARPLVVNDLNGDRYRALEWGLANTRALGDVPVEPGGWSAADMWHPADCTGDTGAASGVLDAIWALAALRKGYARAGRALVWGASDGALRAAAVLALDEED